MVDSSLLVGRQWLANQAHSNIFTGCTKVPVIIKGRCQRCGALCKENLPSGKLYCRACIGIGRAVEGDFLVRYSKKVQFDKLVSGGLTWQGKLTSEQEDISTKLVANFKARKNSLIHAVTGAGKTEITFSLIATCLEEGGRACIATPRIDVVNELYPRLQEAFSKVEIGKYHSQEYKEPGLEQLIICTTHQLLKFYQAFDLLIIDEVDAFPYVNDPQLRFGAKNALQVTGVQVYLTATPGPDLKLAVKQHKLELLTLKRRFHGNLLPVPKENLFLRPFLKNGKLHPTLLKEIVLSIQKGHPLLLFVPRIAQIPAYLEALKRDPVLAKISLSGVYAGDKERLSKVAAFRAGKTQLLVTTTILERGVTFKHVWVIVVAADDQIYTASSLVQIAGRVGRDHNDPSGLVSFCYHRYTRQIDQAIKQIKAMNQ